MQLTETWSRETDATQAGNIRFTEAEYDSSLPSTVCTSFS